MMYSEAYIELLTAGAFAGRIDPWTEAGKYFHQIHGGMIGDFLRQLNPHLRRLGYRAGRERSLQLIAYQEPDVFIVSTQDTLKKPETSWSYAQAAVAIEAQPGERITLKQPELDAVYIYQMETGRLVTIIELVSPGNKDKNAEIARYRQERDEIILKQGVNVVEIDLTRSVKRLSDTPDTRNTPYQVVIYLPDEQVSHIIPIMQTAHLPRIAIPLIQQVVPLEVQSAWEAGYQEANIAASIWDETRYDEKSLPFPSLLTGETREAALQAVKNWRQKLDTLKEQTT